MERDDNYTNRNDLEEIKKEERENQIEVERCEEEASN